MLYRNLPFFQQDYSKIVISLYCKQTSYLKFTICASHVSCVTSHAIDQDKSINTGCSALSDLINIR